MLSKFVQQLKFNNVDNAHSGMTSPFSSVRAELKKIFLKKLSEHAVEMYEHKADVANFTKLALSDPEDLSHNELVNDLFDKKGIKDPFSDLHFEKLLGNENFLKDLGL